MTCPTFVILAQEQTAFGGLARCVVLGRSLDTMIDRVPHDVREKIFDGFDNRLVELDLLPFHIDARKSFTAANNS
jgi:hypothetical protein